MLFAMPIPLRFQTGVRVKVNLDHDRNTMPTTTAPTSEIRMATSSAWHAMSLKSDSYTHATMHIPPLAPEYTMAYKALMLNAYEHAADYKVGPGN
jgi:hypothetical protein